ncbi:hypothetical protein ANANG_G00115660 [Anguilla anguilla]|uniref:Uncharacterized protein n=1 Tax=Anguilla anguilla TaxID=7936 RepID=A0A9D3MI84_ANGAN|nr:hypothetical protein ANANG_G00115660 [Anguilla anguilla]
MRETYGLNLSAFPAEDDMLIYRRFVHLGQNQHKVERTGQDTETRHLENVINLSPVSCFPEDSIYGAAAQSGQEQPGAVREPHPDGPGPGSPPVPGGHARVPRVHQEQIHVADPKPTAHPPPVSFSAMEDGGQGSS